ncbi:DUF3667 domain-containing protein [uncultured Imperialibacter sp.]|uniref:DUF3667 domain-containing protein n=1 Tax=uncultured Imperialibacter sp. TaxID=1672639 RepID=UPI0030DB2AB2|tara:strand:- start:117 stop:881 length:765 start_codon:yes stop_codon:yes gene_type:complete
MVCKNCGTVFQGNFCPTCAQSASVDRFDMKTLLAESFESSLDIETGLFGTLKELAIRPGQAIRGYIDGKRLSLYVPAKFLLLVGAVTTILSIRYGIFKVAQESNFFEDWHWYKMHFVGFWDFANEYSTLINIIAIPIYTFSTWLFFKPIGDNFSEHLVMNIYVTAQQLALIVIMFPFLQLFPDAKAAIITVYTVMVLLYNIWVYTTFFRMKNWMGVTLSIMATAYAQLCTIIMTHLTFLALDVLNLLPYLEFEL